MEMNEKMGEHLEYELKFIAITFPKIIKIT